MIDLPSMVFLYYILSRIRWSEIRGSGKKSYFSRFFCNTCRTDTFTLKTNSNFYQKQSVTRFETLPSVPDLLRHNCVLLESISEIMKINKISHCFSFIERFFFLSASINMNSVVRKMFVLFSRYCKVKTIHDELNLITARKTTFIFLKSFWPLLTFITDDVGKEIFLKIIDSIVCFQTLNSSLGANMLIKSQFLEKKTKLKNQYFSLMPYLIDSRSSNDLLLHNRFFWYSPMKVLDDAG